MNIKRFIIASISVFVFVLAYDWLFHGVFLRGLYEQTKEIWRPEGESYMGFMLLSQICFSFMLTFIFTKGFEGKGIGEGVRFGLLIGLLLASIQIGAYAHLPIPLSLAFGWIVAEFLKGLGAGVVASMTYKNE